MLEVMNDDASARAQDPHAATGGPLVNDLHIALGGKQALSHAAGRRRAQLDLTARFKGDHPLAGKGRPRPEDAPKPGFADALVGILRAVN
jgi:hypothetical protein